MNGVYSQKSPCASPKTKIDLKIVVMGHGGVGKTSFINRYIHDEFTETTIGASFVLKKWKTFYFGIWDTAGQERFTKISSFYCRGAQAAILAYDVTDRGTFEALDNYSKFLCDADKDCIVVVVGTKRDLVAVAPEARQVTPEEGEAYARLIGGTFYETSAKDNLNVVSVFDYVGYRCLASKIGDTPVMTVDHSRVVVAAAGNTDGVDKGCACTIQ